MPYKDIEKKRESARNWVRKHYAERREVFNERSRRYQQENKEMIREKRLTKYREDSEAINAYHRQYRRDHPAAQRGWLMKSRYGVTLEEYRELYDKQTGQCAICGISVPFPKLSVDHNHESGKIRGLLCQNCNAGIGMLGDAPERLTRAAQYLTYCERREIWAQETTY